MTVTAVRKDANALTKALRVGKDATSTIQRLSALHENIRQAEAAIADLQGTSVNTALSRYQYGLTKLRKELDVDGR